MYVILFYLIFKCQTYQIEPLSNDAGMIIEKGSAVKILRGHWKISHYIDISELNFISTKLIDNFIEVKRRIEAKPETAAIFHDDLAVLSLSIENLSNATQNIFSVLDIKREKRSVAPLGFIGYVSKALFGTVTEDDLFQVVKLINDNTEKINEISRLVADQTLIIKEQFKQVNSTILRMNRAFKTTLLRIDKIQNVTLQNQEELKNLNETVHILKSMHLTKSLVDSLNDDYKTILNAILFAKQGTIHPRMLSLKKIFLIVNSTFKNKINERYPLNNIESFDDFSKLIDFGIYVYEGRLLYIVLIPFTDSNSYTLYHAQPEFTNLTVGFGYAKPSSNLHIINNNNKTFVPFNRFMLEKCKFVDNVYVCNNHYFLSKVQKNSPCELKLMIGVKIKNIENCDVRLVKEFQSHWTQSLNVYRLYFSVPAKEMIKIKCNGIETEETISRSGVISLDEDCILESKDFKYKTPKTRTFVTVETISSSVNMKVIKNLLDIVNFDTVRSNFSDDEVLFATIPDLELGIESTKLDTIIKKAEELNSRNRYDRSYYVEKYLPSSKESY